MATHLRRNLPWPLLHLPPNLLRSLLEIPRLADLALHLGGLGALGRTAFLPGSLGDDLAGWCGGLGHSCGEVAESLFCLGLEGRCGCCGVSEGLMAGEDCEESGDMGGRHRCVCGR